MNKHVAPTVIAAEFERFAGCDLIPLKGGEKRPRDAGWQNQNYDAAKVVAKAIAGNSNVGLRLGPTDLVIDVDAKNGGLESLPRLVADFGLNLSEYPCCDTGGGGHHYFLKLSPGVKVIDTHKKYPGIEFKSVGRQVVIAGSIHPATKNYYRWVAFGPDLADAPQAPAKLIEAIMRPLHDFKSSGGGVHTPADVAAMLAGLDPLNFPDNGPWFDIMCACHHASGGDAREEFIAWSWSDPKFTGDESVGERWDLLHREKPGAITVRTLYKALSDAGKAALIPKSKADAFEDDYSEDTPEKKRQRFQTFKVHELLELPPPKWLVRNLFIEGGLFEIFGPYKTGKTFWGVELACCIATGHDFFDEPVKKGKVLYIIAEGSRKLFAYRMDEWAKARAGGDKTKLAELREAIKENVDILPSAVHINDPEHVNEFLKRNPGKRALIIIDTLFRSFKGNVSEAEAFAKFIEGCDFIRRKCETAVLFLHHQKRNDAQGGFGSVVAEASVDAACVVKAGKKEKNQPMRTSLALAIMRDGELVDAWNCSIEVVKLTDPTLKEGDVNTVGVLNFEGRGKVKRVTDDVLQLIHDHAPATIEALAVLLGVSKRVVDKRLKPLRAAGYVVPRKLELTDKGFRLVTIPPEDDFEGDD